MYNKSATDKETKDRGNWKCVGTHEATGNTPGAYFTTWENKTTGEQVPYWNNIGGRGPQAKTLDNMAGTIKSNTAKYGL